MGIVELVIPIHCAVVVLLSVSTHKLSRSRSYSPRLAPGASAHVFSCARVLMCSCAHVRSRSRPQAQERERAAARARLAVLLGAGDRAPRAARHVLRRAAVHLLLGRVRVRHAVVRAARRRVALPLRPRGLAPGRDAHLARRQLPQAAAARGAYSLLYSHSHLHFHFHSYRVLPVRLTLRLLDVSGSPIASALLSLPGDVRARRQGDPDAVLGSVARAAALVL